jgi:hypothetical protein
VNQGGGETTRETRVTAQAAQGTPAEWARLTFVASTAAPRSNNSSTMARWFRSQAKLNAVAPEVCGAKPRDTAGGGTSSLMGYYNTGDRGNRGKTWQQEQQEPLGPQGASGQWGGG